jgi:hypothetical protein
VLGLCRMTQTSGFEAAQSIAPGGVQNQLIVGDAEPMFRNDAGGGPIGRPYKRTLASDSSCSAKAMRKRGIQHTQVAFYLKSL